MNFSELVNGFLQHDGVEESTMMGTPCLRYKGDFVTMFFDKEESLIIKVAPERVDQLIHENLGNEFNYTKKRFKEWVLIPLDSEDSYESYIAEALEYVKQKTAKKKVK